MQGQVDCGVMQETNIIEVVYKRESSGSRVTAMAAPSAHCGGIVVFYDEAEHFFIEELCLHGLNVISFQLVKGRRRWNIVI